MKSLLSPQGSLRLFLVVCLSILIPLFGVKKNQEDAYNLNTCPAPKNCCEKVHEDLAELRKKVASCCSSQTTCCESLHEKLKVLENTVSSCCSSQEHCCEEIQISIENVLNNLDSCCSTVTSSLTNLDNKLKTCCDQQQACCNTLNSGLTAIKNQLTACCNQQTNCCTSLENQLNACCTALQTGIGGLQTTLTQCCLDQATCCSEIMNRLFTIEALINACCSGGGGGGGCCGPVCFISSIPPEGLILDKSCRYIVTNDLFFDGGVSSALKQTSAAESVSEKVGTEKPKSVQVTQSCPLPPAPVEFGITIAVNNVELDLNNHSLTIAGNNIGGVAVTNNVVNAHVTNGTIVGNNVVGQVGVAVVTGQAHVNNVSVVNVGASVPVSVSVVSVVGVVSVVAGAVVVAPVVVGVVSGSTSSNVRKANNVSQTSFNSAEGILLEHIIAVGSVNGITIQGGADNVNVVMRDIFIKDSKEMGITQPSRSGSHGNFILENVLISGSGLNGIYTTFNQDNWILDKVQIRESGLNGALFEGFQNLTIRNCQIAESGAKGLMASIRQSQNISLIGLEVFNTGDEALRVDNVQNLSIEKSQFINYRHTSFPLVKIQDVNNGIITNSEFMSLGGLADGLFIRNSHGFILDTNVVKVFNNVSFARSVSPIALYIQSKYCKEELKAPLVGINLQGGVTATQLRNSVVSGTPDIGIAVQADTLNGIDEGVMIQNVLVDGAQQHGILFSSARNSGVFGSQIVNGQGDGITITGSTHTAVRNNTLTNNRGFGIRNNGFNSQIYQNFAAANGRNYSSNIMSAWPSAGLGSLENISS